MKKISILMFITMQLIINCSSNFHDLLDKLDNDDVSNSTSISSFGNTMDELNEQMQELDINEDISTKISSSSDSSSMSPKSKERAQEIKNEDAELLVLLRKNFVTFCKENDLSPVSKDSHNFFIEYQNKLRSKLDSLCIEDNQIIKNQINKREQVQKSKMKHEMIVTRPNISEKKIIKPNFVRRSPDKKFKHRSSSSSSDANKKKLVSSFRKIKRDSDNNDTNQERRLKKRYKNADSSSKD